MVHLWVRAESRPNEGRVGVTPQGVHALITRGFRVTVEDSAQRIIPAASYANVGAEIAAQGSWAGAPQDAFVFGIKELPLDGTPLRHRHIMFAHAFKGQPAGRELLRRFREGGGALYDLEHLTGEDGRRLAAFGYWAGYAGAAVSLMAWAAQARGGICGPVDAWPDRRALAEDLRARLDATGLPRPRVIVIGAKGRVGTGAGDLIRELGAHLTEWDLPETAHGGPFPEVLQHEVFVNAILAVPGAPVFVPASAVNPGRLLTVIGDVACDPGAPYSPIKVYDHATTWEAPVLRVADAPPLDVMAIENLPALLPLESSLDYAAHLLPALESLDHPDTGCWARARAPFDRALLEAVE